MKIRRQKRRKTLNEIWGSYCGEDVDVGLLGYNAVWTCKKISKGNSKNRGHEDRSDKDISEQEEA